jgi:hypothetical protein
MDPRCDDVLGALLLLSLPTLEPYLSFMLSVSQEHCTSILSFDRSGLWLEATPSEELTLHEASAIDLWGLEVTYKGETCVQNSYPVQ